MNRRQFFRLGGLAAVAPKAMATAGASYTRTTVSIQLSLPSGVALREWRRISQQQTDLFAGKFAQLYALAAAQIVATVEYTDL